MNRRTFIATAGGSVIAALAGCTTRQSNRSSTTSASTTATTENDTSCDDINQEYGEERCEAKTAVDDADPATRMNACTDDN